MESNSHQNLEQWRFRSHQFKFAKRYKTWSGRNTFILGGRLITGSHGGQLLFTALTLSITFLLFLGVVVPFLHVPLLYPLSIVFLTISEALLFVTAFTDPGILPRNLLSVSFDQSGNNNGNTDYCGICDIMRPQRAKHCRFCDNCIEVLDHHCPWTGTCIGYRNYKYFVSFLVSLIVDIILILWGSSLLFVGWIMNTSTDMQLLRIVAVCTMIPWMLFASTPIILLLGFHLYLNCAGRTTNEYFRDKRRKSAAENNNVDTSSSTVVANTMTYSFLEKWYCVSICSGCYSNKNGSIPCYRGVYSSGDEVNTGSNVSNVLHSTRSRDTKLLPMWESVEV